MALRIQNPTAERLAQALADRTGETVEEAIIRALGERLERELQKKRSLEPLPLLNRITKGEIFGI
jgi:antitoxin VapB